MIPPKTRIGHVHLKVANIERSLTFYRDILGFEVTSQINGAVFLSAGGYHHHIGLNTWESEGGEPPKRGSTGLYHFAILYPSRKDLALALKKLLDSKYPISGGADHGVSEAIYVSDPDLNGVELYADRPEVEWRREGKIEMKTEPLDYESLLSEIN